MSALLLATLLFSATPATPDVVSQARALAARGNLEDALQLLDRAVTAGTTNGEVFLLRGQLCLLFEGRCAPEEIVADAREALKRKAASFAAHQLAIEAWFESREFGYPLMEIEKALTETHDLDERLWLLHQEFSAYGNGLDDWKHAAKVAARMVALAPSRSLARGDAALAAAYLNQPEAAIAQLKKLFARDPFANEYQIIQMVADGQLGRPSQGRDFYFSGANPVEPLELEKNGGNVAAAATMLRSAYRLPISADFVEAFVRANCGLLGNQLRWDVVGELGHVFGLPALVGRNAFLEDSLAAMLAAGRRVAAEVTYQDGETARLHWLVVTRALDPDDFEVIDPANDAVLRVSYQALDRVRGKWKVVAPPGGASPAQPYRLTRFLATLRRPGDKPFKREDL